MDEEPKKRRYPYCCSSVEQLNWKPKGGGMANSGRRSGWRISEVEPLLGLSRRDIQRACYQGRGGIGVLSPQNSSWGRCTYDKDDLARLFVLGELKHEGRSLPETKEAFDRAVRDEAGFAHLLGVRVDRLREQSEGLLDRLLCGEALRIASVALGPDDAERPLAGLVGWGVLALVGSSLPDGAEPVRNEVCTCLEGLGRAAADGQVAHSAGAQELIASCVRRCSSTGAPRPQDGGRPIRSAGLLDVRRLFDELLQSSGMCMAIELWLGPGTCPFVERAWDAYETREKEGTDYGEASGMVS